MEVKWKRLDKISFDKLCELCSERNANGYCVGCELYLCKICFKNHLKAKPCRDHVLSSSQSVTDLTARGQDKVTAMTLSENDEVKCEVHEKEAVTFYCATHEIVGCGVCIKLNHRKCEVEHIKGMMDRNKNTASLRTQMEEIEKEVECGIEKLKIYQESNETCNKTALENIHKFRQELDNWLDQAEGKSCSETNELYNKNSSELSKLLDSYGSVRDQYYSLKEGLCGAHQHQCKDFIKTVRAKPLLSVLETSLDKLKLETKALIYRDQFNPRINLDLGYLQKEETSYRKETTQGSTYSAHELNQDRHVPKTNSFFITDWNLCVRSITLSSDNENALRIIDGNGGTWNISSSEKHWLQLEIQPFVIIHRLCICVKTDEWIGYTLVAKGGESVQTLRIIGGPGSGASEHEVTVIEDCDRYYKIIRVEVSINPGLFSYGGKSRGTVYGLSLIGKRISGRN